MLLVLSIVAGAPPAKAEPVGVTFIGTVAVGYGGPFVEGATVDVFPASGDGTGSVATAVSDAAGAWRLDGVPAGAYKFRATAPGFVESWWGGDDFATGGTLTTVDGDIRYPDFHLFETWSSAEGTVWADFEGTPLPGVEVTLHPIDPPDAPAVHSATTDAAGAWRIPDLAFGTYRVHFHDPSGLLPDQWWSAVSGPLGAQEIVAAKNRRWSGINAFAPSVLSNAWSAMSNPVLSGSPLVGETLTVNQGVWAPQPDAFRCIWFRDGAQIEDPAQTEDWYGYEGETYSPVASDVGKKITAQCFALLPGYASLWRETPPVTVVDELQSASVSVQVVVADEALFATDLHGVELEVYDAADSSAPIETVSAEASTGDPIGAAAAMLELEPGEYRLRAVVDGAVSGWWTDAVTGSDDPIAEELGTAGYWPEAEFASSTVLHVAADGVATPGNVLITVYPGVNSILGGVFSDVPDGVDLFGVASLDPGALMEVFPVGSDVAAATAVAGDSGILQVADLPAGSYQVRFSGERSVVPETDPPSVETVSQWWPMQSDRAAARTIDFPAEGGHWIGVTGNLNTTSFNTTEPGDRAAISGNPAVDATVTLDPTLNLGEDPFDALVDRLEQYDFHMTDIRWFADGQPIPGATTTSLKLTPDLEGRSLHAEFTDYVLFGALREQASTTPVTVLPSPLPPLNPRPTPTIGVDPVAGVRLTATVGAWGPGATTRTYQWRRDGVAIPGATATAYTPVGDDVGARLTFAVTAAKPGYATTLRTSAPTAPVAEGALVAPVPTVKGTPQMGRTLTAAAGTWKPTPVALTYQWLRGGAPIDSATASTYVLTAADVGASIAVLVTGDKAGFATSSMQSVATAPVAPGVLTAPVPSVKGTLRVGVALTATTGTWKPAPVDLSYQWMRDGQPIDAATSAGYVLTPDDLGAAISVGVTGTKPGYGSATQVSAPRSPVALGVITNQVLPSILGTAKVGQQLSAAPGAWTPADVTSGYEWLRAGVVIPGAVGPTYTLVDADRNKVIKVRVTASSPGYTSLPKTSAATLKVVP
ncbi:hypothetical protein ATC03_00860 [Agromyces aureus]|uniref:Uncharacterized protein n=1 Tax=Agromyces aureus TaxID=453304 RepID=A0A191WBA3_9MICO|nr:hypothetical protein ATC03_00860 [Agromyces aureus]